jgi:hypothetical protein
MSTGETEINNEVTMYKKLTHELNNYNEIFSLNVYLQKQGQGETDRLTKVNENLKSKILGLKQQHLLTERNVDYYKLKINILYLTLGVICIILAISGLFLKKTLSLVIVGIIGGSLVLLYLIYVIMLINSNAKRRTLFWNQYYWPAVSSKL